MMNVRRDMKSTAIAPENQRADDLAVAAPTKRAAGLLAVALGRRGLSM
jgi:hypothetical protein